MTMTPRIRRSAAAIAALGTAGTGIGLFTSSAEALPPPPTIPVTLYGPTNNVTGLWSGTATSPPRDHVTIDASGTVAGTGALVANGYTEFCGAGGTVTSSVNATGAFCEWPIVAGPPSPYPTRSVGAVSTDSNGLHGSTEFDGVTNHAGPKIAFTATAGTGSAEQRVVIDTAGTTSLGTPTFAIDCGNFTSAVHDTGTLWHCDYTTGGSELLLLQATDSTTGFGSIREAQIYVIAKPVAALHTTRTGALSITADVNGSTVDPHLTGAYSIAWGDGTSTVVDPAVTTQAPHTYSSVPSTPPTLTVTDSATPTAGVATAVGNGLQPGVYRYGDMNRYLTAIGIAEHNWDALSNVSAGARHPQAVVLARSDGYADALAGVPLAAKKKGPLLLTPTASLDPGVQTEIQRILPTTGSNNTVYIVGGLSAVSQNVENQLTTLGYHVVRFGEADRFATALKIASDPNGMNNPAHVVVATGYNFPDALAAGPYAALPSVNAAIVLSQNNAFDAATGTFVSSKLGSGGNVTAIGGQALAAVGGLPGSAGKFISYAGNDRYETAAKVAGWGGTSPFAATAPVGVATGLQFPDALTGGAMMAQLGGPMLLTDQHALSGPTGSVLTTVKPTVSEVDIFGGPVALLPAVTDGIVTAVNGVKHFT